MRTTIYIPPIVFGQSTHWITPDAIEDYAASRIRGERSANRCIAKWSGNDPVKMKLMLDLMIDATEDLNLLEAELIEEFGEEHFLGPPMSKARRVRILEEALLIEIDTKKKAELSKEIRELNGETVRPAEKNLIPSSVSSQRLTGANLLKGDLRETERIVMSVFSSL